MDKQMTTCSCANPVCLEKGCQIHKYPPAPRVDITPVVVSNDESALRLIANLQAELTAVRARAEKAEANYAFMVNRAVNEKLDGYRELGARAASAENEADRLRARLRETAQILITEVGADGPMDAEDAARRAVERMVTLRTLADEKAAEAGLYARRMEQAQRSRDAERDKIKRSEDREDVETKR